MLPEFSRHKISGRDNRVRASKNLFLAKPNWECLAGSQFGMLASRRQGDLPEMPPFFRNTTP